MISFHRPLEREPFLHSKAERSLSGLRYAHATLRQGLYRYFKQAGLKRALIPDFSPAGIVLPLRAAGLELFFYPVMTNLLLDADEIQKSLTASNPDVFVYIHHFGLYHESNLLLLKNILDPRILFVEDLAHSLPDLQQKPMGQIALYAFSKSIGISEGSVLWFRDKSVACQIPYGLQTSQGLTLSSRLQAHARLDSLLATWPLPVVARRWISKFMSPKADYYPYLKSHYREIGSRISPSATHQLECLDIRAIVHRRKELARLYLQGLEARFRLSPVDSAYSHQSLLAFPIVVDNQDRFYAYLVRKGLLGFRLTDEWWLCESRAPSNLFHKHFLLPLNHYMNDIQVKKVVRIVNDYDY